MNPHILLIDCDDEKGIVHRVTGILFEHGLNVDDQAEFVDKTSNHFFMRTEVSGEMNPDDVIARVKELKLKGARIRLSEKAKKNIAILVSKEPHCLGDLLIRHAYGELNARISAVLSNHETLRPLVEKFDLPFYCVPHGDRPRSEHEWELMEVLDKVGHDYIVLAKYMRILTPTFVSRYPNRIINIHHSFLPAFIGAKPYHQAFERGVKIIGATAHFVTQELDDGPIIAQDVAPTSHNKNPKEMQQAGRNVEKIVLANALRLVLEDRVFVHNKHTIIFD